MWRFLIKQFGWNFDIDQQDEFHFVLEPGAPWILAEGFYNDQGIWIDSEVWKDS